MGIKSFREFTAMSMRGLYKDYGLEFVPFRLRAEEARTARSSIGGEPPAGVAPPTVHRETRYFATLALEEAVDVSLFMTLDYSRSGGLFDFYANRSRLQDTSSPSIQFVLHPAALARQPASRLRCEVIALGLQLGSPGRDPAYNRLAMSGDFFEDHKIGGAPYFDHIEGDVAAAYDLLDAGFIHLLQLAFPSKNDSLIACDWFFNDLGFHVFARKKRDTFEFRYIWG